MAKDLSQSIPGEYVIIDTVTGTIIAAHTARVVRISDLSDIASDALDNGSDGDISDVGDHYGSAITIP